MDDIFAGTPAPPRLITKPARLFRMRIQEGVEKGWGVERDTGEQGRPGPNFAGNMIVVQWSSGAPGMEMAVVDARTGEVSCPPISFHGIGAASFDLPLLILGSSVPRNPDVQFRLSSRMMIIKATPKQTQQHSSYVLFLVAGQSVDAPDANGAEGRLNFSWAGPASTGTVTFRDAHFPRKLPARRAPIDA